MLTAADEHVLLRQYLARLFNTFASINEGSGLHRLTFAVKSIASYGLGGLRPPTNELCPPMNKWHRALLMLIDYCFAIFNAVTNIETFKSIQIC